MVIVLTRNGPPFSWLGNRWEDDTICDSNKTKQCLTGYMHLLKDN